MMENQHDTTFELLAILFISHGSSGSHLLFKYPFNDNITKSKKSNKRSYYSLIQPDNPNFGLIDNLSSDVLAGLCVANKENLELRIDNVVFLCSQSVLRINQVIYNVVFALKSPLPRPVIRCYQRLSLAISKALLVEETNSGYLTHQSKILIDSIDQNQTIDENNRQVNTSFSDVLKSCQLAQEFQNIYESIVKSGVIQLTINKNVNLSFCLPHLAYRITEKCEQAYFVDVIFDAIKYLKPYLGILLLVKEDTLLHSLPYNSNNYIRLMIENYNPRFSLARYAAELDVPLTQIYSIVAHLVYWAKVKIIYPISESNVYVLNPNVTVYTKIADEFDEQFGSKSFYYVISELSEGKPVVDHLNARISKDRQGVIIDLILWLLQRNVLMQIHTYMFLMPKKVEHQRLADHSKSEFSIDEDTELCFTTIDNNKGSEHSNDTENTADHRDQSKIYDEYRQLLTEHHVSERDQQYILNLFVKEKRDESEIKLFFQLLPYLNGMHNLEEVMYEEKLNRSDLFSFLDKFKSMIVLSTYEDPNPLLRINVRIN